MRKGYRHSEETKKKISDKAKLRTGKRANHWKGGFITWGGYKYISSHDHPYRTQNGYVAEHRLVMEKKIGRHLLPGEAVHHRNRNTLDNRIENLELCESNGRHSVKHHVTRDDKGKFKKQN